MFDPTETACDDVPMIRDRGRYSRWAIAASAAAALSFADFVTISLYGISSTNRLFASQLTQAGIAIGVIASGPTALVLAKIAIWEINHQPYLRGRLLAECVVVFGWICIAFEIAFAG